MQALKRLATGMSRNVHSSERQVGLQEYTGAQSLERLCPQEVILHQYVRSIVQPHNIPLCDRAIPYLMQFLLEMYDVSFFFFANKYNTEIDIFVIFPSL